MSVLNFALKDTFAEAGMHKYFFASLATVGKYIRFMIPPTQHWYWQC